MREPLGAVTLATGETLEVSCVLGPEPAQKDRIAPFLGHKGDVWNWHIERSLLEPLDSLETRFYIGEIDGRIVGNICTFEWDGIGILGHVYTDPEHRHKGVAGGIMGIEMDDFRRRGGQALTLGTGYGSNAYRIYHGHGFRSVVPESGDMLYSVSPDFFTRIYESRHPAKVRPAEWGDGPRLNLLFLRPGEPVLRNLAYGRFGPSSMEGAGLQLMHDLSEGVTHGAWVLETDDRIPVGFATVTKSRQWPGSIYQLDLHLHPHYEDRAGMLLDGIEWPIGKVTACTERGSKGLFGAMMNAGFRNEGHLSGHLRWNGGKRDVVAWAREFGAAGRAASL